MDSQIPKTRTGEKIKRAEHSERCQLKILYLNYEYPPMGGGAGNATHQTAKQMAARGHQVHVVTSRFDQQANVENDAGVTIHRVFSRRKSIHEAGLFGALTFLFGGFFELRRLARLNDYDVYHFYFGLPTGVLALYVRFVLKKRYVLALRGSDVPGYDKTRWYLRRLHAIVSPLTRQVWCNASAVTALSDSLKALAEESAPKLKIHVIGNGIDPQLFPAKPVSAHWGPIRLLCVSRLVQRKGLEHMLAALRELQQDDVTLDIVGTGECEHQIAALVERLDLKDCVNLVGYVPRNELYIHYHQADIFVLPSLSESFGQVLLEAMACALPVVASRVGGIPETLDDEHGGILIEPANSQAISDAVSRLASDPVLRQKMANYNRWKAR